MRIDRNRYYMEMALLASKRSTCTTQVGCVLIDASSKRIRSVGYNNAPSGVPHCDEEGCILAHTNHKDRDSCIRTVHAEISALSQLRGEWSSLIAYVTHAPCYSCYQALVAFNVKTIYYYNGYEDKNRDRLLEVYKVPLIKID